MDSVSKDITLETARNRAEAALLQSEIHRLHAEAMKLEAEADLRRLQAKGPGLAIPPLLAGLLAFLAGLLVVAVAVAVRKMFL